MLKFLNRIRSRLLMLLLINLVYLFVVWLLRPQALGAMSLFFSLFTVLVISVAYLLERRQIQHTKDAFKRFLLEPDIDNQALLLATIDPALQEPIKEFCEELRRQATEIGAQKLELKQYQEYIEAWTHELKAPLSLAVLLLNKRRDEMTPYVLRRMQHVTNSISTNVDEILFYARLGADHADYRFDQISLSELVQDTLAKFSILIEEKQINTEVTLLPCLVTSDERVLSFLLAQLVNNAIKYSAAVNGLITIRLEKPASETEGARLIIANNGPGVSPEDLPFIFDKGFTGSNPGRQKASGLGLYFVREYARRLAIEIKLPEPELKTSFAIELVFPVV
ncbi:MAG: sensor histidine kinase [Saccharofermentanales bacterium]|jgi:two-component system sensor histidine kinase GraS